MTAQRADCRSASPYALGSATTGALARSNGCQRGALMSATGEFRRPPLGSSDGRRWGEADDR
jgi:hypothetical protein